MYIYIYIYTQIYMHTHIYLYINSCVSECVCVCVCISLYAAVSRRRHRNTILRLQPLYALYECLYKRGTQHSAYKCMRIQSLLQRAYPRMIVSVRRGGREKAICENFSLRVSIIMGMSAHVSYYFGYISLHIESVLGSVVSSVRMCVCVCVCSFICVCCCHCQRCSTAVAVRSYILLQPNIPTLQLQLHMSYIFICRCHCQFCCAVVGVVSVCKSCVCNSVWCCSVSGDGPDTHKHTHTHAHIQVDILKSQLATQFAATHCT